MIQKYDLFGEYDCYMGECEEGEYVKWEDVKHILHERFIINVLNTDRADVVFFRPTERVKPEYLSQMMETLRDSFDEWGMKDIKLVVLNSNIDVSLDKGAQV